MENPTVYNKCSLICNNWDPIDTITLWQTFLLYIKDFLNTDETYFEMELYYMGSIKIIISTIVSFVILFVKQRWAQRSAVYRRLGADWNAALCAIREKASL